MESQVIHDLQILAVSNPQLPFWSEFQSKSQNPDYLKSLLNVVLSPQCDYSIRVYGISALISFSIKLPLEIVSQFFPLLADEKFQRLIAHYIIKTNHPQIICGNVFPFLCQQIQKQEQNGLLNGLILCFYEFVCIYKQRDETIIQGIYQILLNGKCITPEILEKAIEILLLQINYIPFQNKELIQKDRNNLLELFLKLLVNENNLIMYRYLLFFIKKNIIIFESSNEVRGLVLQKLFLILDLIITKCPLDPNDYACSTTLGYLFDIFSLFKISLPFDKIFPLMIIGDKQLSLLQRDVDAFCSDVICDCNGYTDNHESVEYNEDNECNESSDRFDNIEALSDTQDSLRMYVFNQSVEYKTQAISYCFSIMNQSPFINISILSLFSYMSGFIPPAFDPSTFNCFNNPILVHSVLSYCGSKDTPSNTLFLQKFNFKQFAQEMFNSNNPVYTLLIFDIILNNPKYLSDPEAYAFIFMKTLTVLPNITLPDARTSLFDNINSYLSANEPPEIATLLSCPDANSRRFLSTSIFKLQNQIITAFQNKSPILFGDVLPRLFTTFTNDYEMTDCLAKLVQFFTGGNVNCFVNRFRTNEVAIVDMSQYSAFFPIISQNFMPLIATFLSNPELVDCGLPIFAYAFSNIYYPNDQNYVNFVTSVYQMFYNNVGILCNISWDAIDLILRIFIKNGKLEKIDEFCFKIVCQNKPDILRYLIFEYSFIIINKYNVYSSEIIQSIIKKLIRIFYLSCDESQCLRNPFLVKSIGEIFARVALSLNKEGIEMVLNCIPIRKDINNVDLFLSYLFKDINGNIFDCSKELNQKMLISLYVILSDHQNASAMAQVLLSRMVKVIMERFIENQRFGILYSTFSVVEEDTFYDDTDFLLHPLISSNICHLINSFVKNPINQECGALCAQFLNKFPNL